MLVLGRFWSLRRGEHNLPVGMMLPAVVGASGIGLFRHRGRLLIFSVACSIRRAIPYQGCA